MFSLFKREENLRSDWSGLHYKESNHCFQTNRNKFTLKKKKNKNPKPQVMSHSCLYSSPCSIPLFIPSLLIPSLPSSPQDPNILPCSHCTHALCFQSDLPKSCRPTPPIPQNIPAFPGQQQCWENCHCSTTLISTADHITNQPAAVLSGSLCLFKCCFLQ